MSVANTYSPNITWNAELYDTKHNFVSKYGEDVLGWLEPQEEEQILDLGCGTGELAAKIQASGAIVTGMDDNLKKGGRLVLEMGGKSNVKSIVTAIKKAMASEGLSDKLSNEFWFFPSLSEYTEMLERQGFRVTSAVHFDRPTKLEGENGMENWIRMFGGFFFSQITTAESETVIKKAVEYLRRDFYKNGAWYADYVRLRVKAVKV